MVSPIVKINSKYQRQQSFDLPLALTVISLALFGLFAVYDSSTTQALRDFKDSNYYIKQQLIWTIIGFFSCFTFTNFDYLRFKKLAFPMLIISFSLLLAVFIPGIGISGGGAHRWLNLGFFTLQPAEIIKLTGIIYLASIFEKKVRFMPFVSLLIFVTVVLAFLQKDLGSTIIFVAIAVVLYFVSNAPLWHFLIVIPPAVISVLVLILTSSYRSKRVLAFLDPFSDTQGFTYHILQVLIALGSGGLFGLGIGASRQKFEYIPEVTTDSIFAVIGEELGFFGGLLLIGLFVFLAYRGFKIANDTQDNFGKILSLGITCWLSFQAVINLSSMVALLPLTGVPLPFISYGGSAMIVNMTAIGILLNISKGRS